MITMQSGAPASSAYLKEFPALNDAINKSIHYTKKTASIIFEYAKKVTAFALTIILAAFFPGSFILGTCTGLLIGVIATPERLKESLDTISKVWQRQHWLIVFPLVGMAFLGLPYTTYLTAIVRGAYFGIDEVLKAKSDKR
jgi:hypothetical protein